MAMMINNVQCDTFAYIDEKRTGETVLFRLSGREVYSIVVYLYANNKPFPVDSSMTAECCVKEEGVNNTNASMIIIDCAVGTGGQITVPIPPSLRTAGKNLCCEINIIGTDSNNQDFRYKASSFRLAILN